MEKEKIFKFFLNYIYSVIISFLLMMSIAPRYFQPIREAIIFSLISSVIIGWALVGLIFLQIIKGVFKDIKEKKYRNLIAWLIAFLIFAPYYLKKIFIE